MATTVRIEIDKHKDGRWETYSQRTVPGKGSNARSGMVGIAKDLARGTNGTLHVRVRCEGIDLALWTVWQDDWDKPRWIAPE